MKKLEAANAYIQKHKETVTNRPLFHFTPEIGWINDPNGFSFYRGEYHLFYQYYPYDVVWSDMHWGHATTLDFVDWNYQPVALANDKLYDANGCFSGSAIEKDDKLFLMYTGHIDPNMGFDKDESQIIQQQCIAVSEDGIRFEKHPQNPVIGASKLPEGYMICDFRDPKVVEVDGAYYCVLSVRNAERRGEIIMYKSSDLLDWTFHASVYQTVPEENMLLECPDLFRIDGRDVLLFSIMPCDPEFEGEVVRQTAYVIGKMDYAAGVFQREGHGLLDYGNSFYAPQSTEGENGERLLIGWMQSWKQAAPPKEYGFNGMMSLPRELKVHGHTLTQQPLRGIVDSFKTAADYENLTLEAGEALELAEAQAAYVRLEFSSLENKTFELELHKKEGKSNRIHVDVETSLITFTSDYGDQDTLHMYFNPSKTDVTLEVFVDSHSVELFVNEGEQVLTSTAYDCDKGKGISLHGTSPTVFQSVSCKLFEK